MAIFDPRLNAILSPPALARFCRRFDLRAGDLEPVATGWIKVVLLTRNRAFVFPRDEQKVPQFRRELEIYEVLAAIPDIPAPRLLERVRDANISPHEFAVISRPKGVPFSDLWDGAGSEGVTALMVQLGRAVARWHSIPIPALARLPKPLSRPPAPALEPSHRWVRAALSPRRARRAASYAHSLVLDLGDSKATKPLRDGAVIAAWAAALREIADLDHVLVHGDIHDDQLFVLPRGRMRVTAVLDWEGACIDHPALDFDFGEWGAELWKRRADFGHLRRSLWTEYLRARRLRLDTVEGLHLLFTLAELMSAVSQRDRPRVGFTNAAFRATVSQYVDRLHDVTKTL